MTILTSFTLVVLIILASLFIAYNVQKGTKTLQEFKDNYYDNEAEQQIVEPVLTEEVTKPKKKRKYYPKKPKTSI